MPTAETIERVNNAYARRLQREYDAEAAVEDERRQRRRKHGGNDAATNGDASTQLEDRPPSTTTPHATEVDVDGDDGPSPTAPPISRPRSPQSQGQEDGDGIAGPSAAFAVAGDGRWPTKPVVEEYLVEEARERASFDARLAMRMHRDYLKEKKAEREAERVRRFSIGSSLSGDSWTDLHALESSTSDVECRGGGHVQTPVARRTGATLMTRGSHEDAKDGGDWRWWAVVVLRSVVAAIAVGVAVGFTAKYFLF